MRWEAAAGLSHLWQQLEWSSSSPKHSAEKALLEKEPEIMALCPCSHITASSQPVWTSGVWQAGIANTSEKHPRAAF